MKKNKKKDNEVQIEKAIQNHAESVRKIVEFLNSEEARVDDLPPQGKNYTMTVYKHCQVAGSYFIKNPVSQSTRSLVTIQLSGDPSPDTPKGFSLAYLNFVDSGQPLKRPQVVESSGYLVLFIDYPLSYLATIEKMLREAKVCYCWVANLSYDSQTYIHADIHAEY